VIWVGAGQKQLSGYPLFGGATIKLGYCWVLTLLAWLMSLPNIFVAIKLKMVSINGDDYPESQAQQPNVPYQSAYQAAPFPPSEGGTASEQ